MLVIELLLHACEKEAMNSVECSKFDPTSAAMIFNNGYVVIMDTDSMMDNTLQVTIQPLTAKHSIYYYFSSTFEVSVYLAKATYNNG